MNTEGIAHTRSQPMPCQPRWPIRSSVSRRRRLVTRKVAKVLISSRPSRCPAASRSTASLASSAAGVRSAGSSLSSSARIGAGSIPAMSACRPASASIFGPPPPIISGGRGRCTAATGRASESMS